MSRPPITIADLYPDLPPEKREEVAEAFDRYLDFVARTYERIESDPSLREELLFLTRLAERRTINGGRSFTNPHNDTDV